MSVSLSTVFNTHFTSRSGVKDFVKVVVNLQDWFKFFEFTEASQWFGEFAGKCKIVKSVLCISDIHQKAVEFYKLCGRADKLVECTGKWSELTIHAYEGVELLRSVKWITLSQDQANCFDLLLNLAGTVKSVIGLHKEYGNWCSNEVAFKVKRPTINWDQRTVNYLQEETIDGSRTKIGWDQVQLFSKVTINTAHLAKAILGMALFSGLVASAGVAGLMISTTITVVGIFEHFIKNLYIQQANLAHLNR